MDRPGTGPPRSASPGNQRSAGGGRRTQEQLLHGRQSAQALRPRAADEPAGLPAYLPVPVARVTELTVRRLRHRMLFWFLLPPNDPLGYLARMPCGAPRDGSVLRIRPSREVWDGSPKWAIVRTLFGDFLPLFGRSVASAMGDLITCTGTPCAGARRPRSWYALSGRYGAGMGRLRSRSRHGRRCMA